MAGLGWLDSRGAGRERGWELRIDGGLGLVRLLYNDIPVIATVAD